MQNKRRKGTSGQVLVEQTILIGALIVGFLLLVPLYVSPSYSGALRPLGRLGTSLKGRAASIWSRRSSGSTVTRNRPVLVQGERGIVRRPSTGGTQPAVRRAAADVGIMLTPDDREALMLILSLNSSSDEAILRARALIMAADGKSSRFIAGALKIDETDVREWRTAFMGHPVSCGREGDRMACRHDFQWAGLEAAERPMLASAPSAEESR